MTGRQFVEFEMHAKNGSKKLRIPSLGYAIFVRLFVDCKVTDSSSFLYQFIIFFVFDSWTLNRRNRASKVFAFLSALPFHGFWSN
jgi:hypothetical protein